MYIRSSKEMAEYVVTTRKELGLSQSEVANRAGLKQKTISSFENNPNGTKLMTLFRILSAVQLDLNLSLKDDKEVKSSWTEEW